jgi:alkanesulfonate monooxygenase SsuD/methylene tetrahydromethanopterin reductase-like flavin-dependent oxidoreductase (luciferase family)
MAAEGKLRASIVGSEATVKEGLERLVAVTGADELIVVTDTWDHATRLESYRRLAEIAGRIQMKTTAALLGTAR